MATLSTVRLNRGDYPSWGFRLQGGKDFGTPLVIQKVNGGSPAERAGLTAGDAVIKINNVDVYNLLHKEAQDVIVRSGSNFDMVIQRGGSTWKPQVVPTGTFPKPSPVINNVSPVTQTSLAANKRENIGAIGTGHNVAAKPFNTQVNGAVNGGPQLVNKQYNSPLKLYSEDAIAESLSAQTEVLSTGALGVNFKKNEKDYDATNSEVYRMLQEAENDREDQTEPDSGIVTAPNRGMAGLRHVEAPISRPAPPNPQLPPGQNICADCERLIVGVFVRIKDKNLHVECFKCATCGSSLKNVGYYNINNKLYCDIHAKAAAIAINNPSSYPVTLSPGGKAPASAISAALSGHSYPSSPLSAKAPSYTPSYQPAEEVGAPPPSLDDLSSTPIASLPSLNNSAPSAQSNIKPSISSNSLFNTSAPLSFSKYINKPSNFSGPKPFSSVSAPLSPGGTLPRAAPLSPQINYNKAPLSPSAPSFGSYSPSSNAGRCTNITWPPTHEDPEIPTACPLFYAPISKVEAELEKKSAIKKQSKFESEYFAEESEDVNMDETMSFYSEELNFSDRRSATECVEILSETLDTQRLVENAVKASPQIVFPTMRTEEINQQKSRVETSWGSSCPASLPDTECCQKRDSCELKRLVEFKPNTVECELPSKVENAVPQKWESTMTQAVRTVSPDSDTFSRIPSRHSAHKMASALAIAPSQPFTSMPHNTLDHVPLPEETIPYFPPEHPIIPVDTTEEKKTEDKPPAPKTKSPFIKAMEIAPKRPFTPVGGAAAAPPVKKKPKDPLDKLFEDLPKPAEKLDMRSALTTAPERCYTPIITEFSSASSDTRTKYQKSHNIDRSQLIKPLKPEELPSSFQMNVKEPKPPSYYAPAVIEERINSELQETTTSLENKGIKIIEKETIQVAPICQSNIAASQDTQPASYAPMFQGFTCSFKNKTDHSQFSVEVSTTPPVPTPPPKSQTPISYIATVEQKPSIITRGILSQETQDRQNTSTSQTNITYEAKVNKEITQKQEVQKQAEEIISVKTLPVTAMLRKAEALPSYQVDLQAAAESELRIMEKRRKAEERLAEQKKGREQNLAQQSQEHTIHHREDYQSSLQAQTFCQQQSEISSFKQAPSQPERHHLTKPIITVEPGDTNTVAEKVNFQTVPHEKPPSATFSPRPRSMTPSMINKAPALLPYYQDNLVAHFHAPVSANVLDPTTPHISRSPSPNPEMRLRSPSPLPTKPRLDRAKSPAQGPPSNPLRSLSPLPTPQDARIQLAKENLKTYLPEYKCHRDSLEQRSGVNSHDKFQQSNASGVSQVVAYPKTSSDSQFSVQTGNVQHMVQSREQQHVKIADIQKQQTPLSNDAAGSCKIDISEKSHCEQLEASRQSQSQSIEKSSDGVTQIQRKKIVTEEFEQSHKETNIQIEKNVTSVTAKHPFTKVNVPSLEPPIVQSFHITDPQHRSSCFKAKEATVAQQIAQNLESQNTLQQGSQQLTQLNQSKQLNSTNHAQPQLDSNPLTQSQPIPPPPPTRHVFPQGSLAPINHVTPSGACQKPSQNVTKPNVPKPDVGAGAGRQTAGITAAPKRGRGLLNAAAMPGARIPLCGNCHGQIRSSVLCANGGKLGGPGRILRPESDSATQNPSRHASEVYHTNLCETVTDLDEVCQRLPPPPTVPVYSQINITIPQHSFHTSSQLDSIGSSPRSDYSSHSSSSGKHQQSMDTAKEKIITVINKGLLPKLKRVSLSETQSPRLNYIVSNVNTVIENNVKRVRSELVIPINSSNNTQSTNTGSRIATENSLPDHLTFANKSSSHHDFTETTFKSFESEDVQEKFKDSASRPICWKCNTEIFRGPFITALGKIWCPHHFICATPSCRRPLQDLGFVEEKGQLYCEYCFEQYLAPPCSKCHGKIKGDCLKAIGKNFHPECFNCVYCGKLFGNNPFFLEDGNPYCDADWNELFTTKCYACGFPVEAGDRWVEALSNNYHSQCFNCTMCKKNLEGQSFFAKGGRPFCKTHAR